MRPVDLQDPGPDHDALGLGGVDERVALGAPRLEREARAGGEAGARLAELPVRRPHADELLGQLSLKSLEPELLQERLIRVIVKPYTVDDLLGNITALLEAGRVESRLAPGSDARTGSPSICRSRYAPNRPTRISASVLSAKAWSRTAFERMYSPVVLTRLATSHMQAMSSR